MLNPGTCSLGGLVHEDYKINRLQPLIFKELYKATVCKTMDYGAGVWGGPSYKKCDIIQHRATSSVLGVTQQKPVPFIYFELGWIPKHSPTKGGDG